MNFINNWRQQMALAMAATSVSLDLPDGQYVLTMSDGLGASATQWEYIRATVTAGEAVLEREQEGSDAQEWPAGSWIYCSVTAGVLAEMVAQLAAQAGLIELLSERVAALEGAPPPVLALTVGSPGFWAAGFMLESFGNVAPSGLDVPGYGVFPVSIAQCNDALELTLIFSGHFPVETIASINVQGVGELLFADASHAANESDGSTAYAWDVPATDWFDAVGQIRTLEFTFAA